MPVSYASGPWPWTKLENVFVPSVATASSRESFRSRKTLVRSAQVSQGASAVSLAGFGDAALGHRAPRSADFARNIQPESASAGFRLLVIGCWLTDAVRMRGGPRVEVEKAQHPLPIDGRHPKLPRDGTAISWGLSSPALLPSSSPLFVCARRPRGVIRPGLPHGTRRPANFTTQPVRCGRQPNRLTPSADR